MTEDLQAGTTDSRDATETAAPLHDGAAPRLSWPRTDVLLIGPSGCGKSALMSSLFRSAQLEVPAPQLDVRVLPLGEGSCASGSIAGSSRTVRADIREYQIELYDEHGLADDLELSIVELPSEILFDSRFEERRRSLQARPLRQAASVVFCVDASKPDSEAWSEALPMIVASLSSETGRFVRTLEEDLSSPKLRLGCARALVLLTRIDRVAKAWVNSVGASAIEGLLASTEADSAASGARRLARAIEPIELLREVLGFDLPAQLRGCLRQGADIAVGVVTTTGFGERDPQPLGLREALAFVAGGAVEGSFRRVPKSSRRARGPRVDLSARGRNV